MQRMRLPGPRLTARGFCPQITEFQIGVSVLNGVPRSTDPHSQWRFVDIRDVRF